MANQPPICKKCETEHWPFKPCPQPEQQPPGEVIWPAAPEGYREPRGFGDGDMLSRSLGEAGFGAPGLAGWTKPKRRS